MFESRENTAVSAAVLCLDCIFDVMNKAGMSGTSAYYVKGLPPSALRC